MARPTSFSSVLLNLYEVGVTGKVLYVNGLPVVNQYTLDGQLSVSTEDGTLWYNDNPMLDWHGKKLFKGPNSFNWQCSGDPTGANDIVNLHALTGQSGLLRALFTTGGGQTGAVLLTGNQSITGFKTFFGPTEHHNFTAVLDTFALGGINVIQANNQRLVDHSGQLSVDWTNRNLQFFDGPISVDWQNSLLSDPAAISSVDWNNRILYNANGSWAYNWGLGILNDTGGNPVFQMGPNFRIGYSYLGNVTLDWGNSNLINGNSSPSLDWTNLILIDSGNLTTLDWGQRFLYDSSQVKSEDWNSRVLYGLTGGRAVSWNSGLLYNTNQTTAVDWKNEILSGANWSTNTFASQPNHIVNKSAMNAATGSLPAIFDLRYVQTGVAVTTGQTGQFYPMQINPSGYVTGFANNNNTFNKAFEGTGQTFYTTQTQTISGFVFPVGPGEGWLAKMFIQFSGTGSFPLQAGFFYAASGGLFRQTTFGTANSVSSFSSDNRLTPGLCSSNYGAFSSSSCWMEIDATLANNTAGILLVSGIAALSASGISKSIMSGSYIQCVRYK